MNRNFSDIVQMGRGKVLKDQKNLNLCGFDDHWLIESVTFIQHSMDHMTMTLKIVINVFDMGY
jgi:hypothetical protein